MQQLEPREFGRRTAAGRPCGHYDLSLYFGLSFECACQQTHDLKPWMEILSELPMFRFVVVCPEGKHLTVLNARWNREKDLRELIGAMGTELRRRRVPARGPEFQAGLLETKTGRQRTRS